MKNDWYIVGEVRRYWQWRWNIGGSILLLLLASQSTMGQYQEMLPNIWAWASLLLLLPWAVLLLSSWLGKRPQKMVPRQNRQLIGYLSILYLLALLLTIFFSELGAQRMAISLRAYFNTSYYWLMLPAILLTASFYATLIRAVAKYMPNTHLIKEQATVLQAQAKEKGAHKRAQLFALIAEGQLSTALEHLSQLLQGDDEQYKYSLLLQSQWQQWQQESQMGLLEDAEAQLRLNKITMASLNLIANLRVST